MKLPTLAAFYMSMCLAAAQESSSKVHDDFQAEDIIALAAKQREEKRTELLRMAEQYRAEPNVRKRLDLVMGLIENGNVRPLVTLETDLKAFFGDDMKEIERTAFPVPSAATGTAIVSFRKDSEKPDGSVQARPEEQGFPLPAIPAAEACWYLLMSFNREGKLSSVRIEFGSYKEVSAAR